MGEPAITTLEVSAKMEARIPPKSTIDLHHVPALIFRYFSIVTVDRLTLDLGSSRSVRLRRVIRARDYQDEAAHHSLLPEAESECPAGEIRLLPNVFSGGAELVITLDNDSEAEEVVRYEFAWQPSELPQHPSLDS